MGNQPNELDERDPILTVGCREPNGEVIRCVRLEQLSFDRIKFLWDKLKEFDVLFNDFVREDFEAFVNRFIVEVDGVPEPTGIFWSVDDVGLIYLNELRPLESAQAHFLFWDRRFKGREKLCQELLAYAFEKYKFQVIYVQVPLYAPRTISAVEKLGFFQEGRLRNRSLYKDEWFDLYVYSILPDEVEPGQIFETRSRGWGELRGVDRCWYCGKVLQSHLDGREDFRTKDHKIPKSEGGTQTVTCCFGCNQEKKDMSVDEFREVMKVTNFYGEENGI